MGRVEKVVVLTVLFIVAVILGVSLNGDRGDEAGPLAHADQLSPAPPEGRPDLELASAPSPVAVENAPRGRETPPDAEEPAPRPLGPAGLLNASVEVPPATPAAAEPSGAGPATAAPAEGAPAPGYLRTTEGLEPSPIEELSLYTWSEGDSFAGLAERFYGSRLEALRLRQANEGRAEESLSPGQRILVPVSPPALTSRAEAARTAGEWDGGSVYVVKAGDVLGTIAQEVYGSASQWKRIWQANTDVIPDPNTLRVGTRLRIPE